MNTAEEGTVTHRKTSSRGKKNEEQLKTVLPIKMSKTGSLLPSDKVEGNERKSRTLTSSILDLSVKHLPSKGKQTGNTLVKKRKRQKKGWTEDRLRSGFSPLMEGRKGIMAGAGGSGRWRREMCGRWTSGWISSLPYSALSYLLGWGENSDSPITRRETELAGKISRIPLPSFLQRGIFDITSALQALFIALRSRFLLVCVLLLFVLCFWDGILPEIPHALKPIVSTFSNVFVAVNTEESERPGLRFYEKFNHGSSLLPRRHPVLILPGFITTGLEVWEANNTCLKRLNMSLSLRQWMLGAKMILLMLRDPGCWFELFSLDPVSGMDKPGTRVRGGEGAGSVGEFVPGFWVWEKIIRNLADIGYDSSSLAVATYDWRLSPDLLQERDGFFYRMKHLILQLYEQHHEQRIIIIGHSYASTVLVAFLRWAEEREPEFLNTHISGIINIGGLTLGAFKTLSATLFGDVRDTLDIPRVFRRVLDQVVDAGLRSNLSRTWSSLLEMLPHPCLNYDNGLLHGRDGVKSSTREALEKLRLDCKRTGHTICAEKVEKRLAYHNRDALPHLPYAPNTTMYCLYGVNKPTEVGYHVRRVKKEKSTTAPTSSSSSVSPTATTPDISSSSSSPSPPAQPLSGVGPVEANDSLPNGGVLFAEGDGTVPLASLAYMCRAPNGWKKSLRRVVTLEFLHNTSQASLLDFRGGHSSGDHVDILGNHDALEVILRIVSGVEEEEEEKAAASSSNNVKYSSMRKVPGGVQGKQQQLDQQQHHPGRVKETPWNTKDSLKDYPSLTEDTIFSNVDELLESKVVEHCKQL